MEKISLVIMAAGMGSRFGGLKQMTPVDNDGHVIMDFSVYDAARAGFDDVIIIIKPENKEDFHRLVGCRIEKLFPVKYAYQTLDNIPAGFTVPDGREKPWGTAHAVLCAAPLISGSFAVINADDFYGAEAFCQAYKFMSSPHGKNEHAMIGYLLKNTLTENGSVARGICETGADGNLISVTERTHIEQRPHGAAFSLDGGKTFKNIHGDPVVSMNFWCFSNGILPAFTNGFQDFLQNTLPKNPLKAEYFLPSVVSGEIESGHASVKVLPCHARWHGVTYREDLESVVKVISDLENNGAYIFG